MFVSEHKVVSFGIERIGLLTLTTCDTVSTHMPLEINRVYVVLFGGSLKGFEIAVSLKNNDGDHE